jgi:hypothetical protein
MALSDACFEALNTLQDEMVSYADWEYAPSELSKVVEAMYELASFFARHDIDPDASQEKLEGMLDGIIVANILDKAHEEECDCIGQLLADVAKVNPRLSQSIDNMTKKLSSKEHFFDAIKNARMLSQLNEIKKLKCA